MPGVGVGHYLTRLIFPTIDGSIELPELALYWAGRDLISLVPSFCSIYKIKHDKVIALSLAWLGCAWGRYCPLLD